MKKGFKKLAAIGLTCAMIVGMSITAGAHPYYYSDNQGNTYVISCYVTLLNFREVWKCGCGDVEYGNYWNEYRHSVCGQ